MTGGNAERGPTAADLLADPSLALQHATVDTRTAALLFCVSYECLLDAAKAGEAPVAPIRVGRILRWPTRPLLALLGIEAG